MASETKNTSGVNYNAGETQQTAVPDKVIGDAITHDEFIEMLDILESLDQHSHNYQDTYTTNCECQCGGGGQI